MKTSTGFNKGGATVRAVEILAAVAHPAHLGVKAAGGIRDLTTAEAMLQAGADRLGTSAGKQIVEGQHVR